MKVYITLKSWALPLAVQYAHPGVWLIGIGPLVIMIGGEWW